MDEPLIKLKRTLNDALSFRDSQQNRFYVCSGVQLLPNNTQKYVQVTDIEDGMHLEDWTVNVVDIAKGTKVDITDYFFVDSLTNDLNGNPQLFWSITNVPFDFGYKLQYLEIIQAVGETFYSTPFMLTDYNKYKTTQYHYKAKKSDVMQSIGVQSWFRQIQRNEELTQYYETSTKTTVTTSQKLNKLEKYYSEVMPLETLDLLMDILSSPYLYVDGIRSSLYEAPKMPDLSASQNFGQIEFMISPKKWDIYKSVATVGVGTGDFSADDFDEDDFLIFKEDGQFTNKIFNGTFNNIFG
jgi:hypothetical protein